MIVAGNVVEGSPAAEAPVLSLLESLRHSRRPLVIVVRRKKRRRYTRGLGDLQKVMDAQARATSRMMSALAAGSRKYNDRTKASALRKRDGALEDHWRNFAAALRTLLRKSSKVPSDLASAVTPGLVRRHILGSLGRALAQASGPLLVRRLVQQAALRRALAR